MKPFTKLLVVFVVIAPLTVLPQVIGWNDASRLATVQSLVEHHSLAIDKSEFVITGDKIFYDDKYYSDKPPIPSLIGALAYLPIYHLGFQLAYGWNWATFLVILMTMKVFWVLGLVAFYKSLKVKNVCESTCLWATAALGLGSIYLSWSACFNNHLVAASSLSIGFYFWLKSQAEQNPKRNLFYSGFFVSLAATADIPTALFFVTMAFYLLFQKSLRRHLVFFLLPLCLAPTLSIAINYATSGSVFPIQLDKSLYDYPGSPWVGPQNVGNLSGVTVYSISSVVPYSFACLFGKEGFLLYNPILLIAIPVLVMQIFKKGEFRSEALLIAPPTILLMGYYFFFTNNWGGWSYSIRWFVPLLPLLFLFLAPFIDSASRLRMAIFKFVLAVSMLIALVGVANPYSYKNINVLGRDFSEVPFVSNLKLLYYYQEEFFGK